MLRETTPTGLDAASSPASLAVRIAQLDKVVVQAVEAAMAECHLSGTLQGCLADLAQKSLAMRLAILLDRPAAVSDGVLLFDIAIRQAEDLARRMGRGHRDLLCLLSSIRLASRQLVREAAGLDCGSR